MNRLPKLYEAVNILMSCIGDNGVWADPTRYRGQCWTRDFNLAILPALLDLGLTGIAREHLDNLYKRQRSDGAIPILFLDGVSGSTRFLLDKGLKSVRDGKMSFMLGKYLRGELYNLTPGTRDSELHYIIAQCEFFRAVCGCEEDVWRSIVRQPSWRSARGIDEALAYIESNLLEDGLLTGADWRDTMEKQLHHTPLLSNNSLLVRVYDLLGEDDKAHALRERIEKAYWVKDLVEDKFGHLAQRLQDWPGNTRFDPLGASLAVLHDVVGADRYRDILYGFDSVDTEHGVTIQCKHNPFTGSEEARVIEDTKGNVIWPFVMGFSILALLKMSKKATTAGVAHRSREMASNQFAKYTNLEGFREWYDPRTGLGYGAYKQLWSATLYVRTFNELITLAVR